jgi:hypothetical protein
VTPWRRRLARAGIIVAIVYVVLSAGLYAIMTQPPATIGTFFKRIPWPFFAALPMKPMWMQARAGTLDVGDPAPAFDLVTWDRQSRVRLESLRGKPVVLVFGSYT